MTSLLYDRSVELKIAYIGGGSRVLGAGEAVGEIGLWLTGLTPAQRKRLKEDAPAQTVPGRAANAPTTRGSITAPLHQTLAELEELLRSMSG